MEVPEGCVFEKWELRYNDNGRFVTVAFTPDTNNIYIKGIYPQLPDAWVLGNWNSEENAYSFESGQYMGLSESYNSFTYFIAAAETVVSDPEIGEYEAYTPLDRIMMKYDASSRSLLAPDNQAWLINTYPDRINYIMALRNPKLSPAPEKVQNVAPSTPVMLAFDDTFDIFGFSSIVFDIPPFNLADDLLDVNDMSYIVYIDGDPITFYADEYALSEDMTEIPYTLYSEYGIFGGDWPQHIIYLYATDISTIGAQSIYTTLDGTQLKSEVATLNVDPNGVNSINSNVNVRDVRYYTPQGMITPNPGKGIYIEVITYDDGSQKVRKVML